MTNENAILALLESKEAEANAEAEWIAEWVEANQHPLLAGMLDTDAAALLGEVNADQAAQLNQAIYLLMVTGDKFSLMGLLQQLMDKGLAELAQAAWNDHVAALHDAMSEEQFERYLQRSAA